VTGSNILQKEAAEKKHQNLVFAGMAIGLPEVISSVLGYPQVFTKATFIHIPSVPLEERPTFLKTSSTKSIFPEAKCDSSIQTSCHQKLKEITSDAFIGKIV
jgi:hypothetical protein